MVQISDICRNETPALLRMTDNWLLQYSTYQQITTKDILLPWFFSHVWWYRAQYSLHHCKMFSVFVCLQTQIYTVVRITSCIRGVLEVKLSEKDYATLQDRNRQLYQCWLSCLSIVSLNKYHYSCTNHICSIISKYPTIWRKLLLNFLGSLR